MTRMPLLLAALAIFVTAAQGARSPNSDAVDVTISQRERLPDQYEGCRSEADTRAIVEAAYMGITDRRRLRNHEAAEAVALPKMQAGDCVVLESWLNRKELASAATKAIRYTFSSHAKVTVLAVSSEYFIGREEEKSIWYIQLWGHYRAK